MPVTFRRIFRVLQATEGVADVKRNWFSEAHITFNYRGEPFVINEPWGDSSRYWVGPQDAETSKVDPNIAPQGFSGWLAYNSRSSCF